MSGFTVVDKMQINKILLSRFCCYGLYRNRKTWQETQGRTYKRHAVVALVRFEPRTSAMTTEPLCHLNIKGYSYLVKKCHINRTCHFMIGEVYHEKDATLNQHCIPCILRILAILCYHFKRQENPLLGFITTYYKA